ncbi:NitT/TauT family transport system ATP-binding protein [Halanaerobium saccharolyticum]|uniref:ABC-type quaternary amine transporter n=1 Tax=Halanaerobium saccharolyticum TaxID=43595 RepID=A0A4R7YZ58_9FIRM|nr:ABC transporter ATP-binding protein [Halanaerobium saccharolyticum]RAK12717.1 NitT/TauT family transport system ATP-binding protein [Halanaerobium saccharolyticum]TDW02930.1 NitT/TauT family transport system ATP-binding protein [Halanaerobium saccharolyticum]TDX62886.1 NitT/TauT family transport system ATP-binding protein [Halanaerobium saccharolyticum]
MIEVKELDFAYQKEKVLKNINLEVKKGESLAVIGPSGCGKTTLLYLLAGLEQADQGTIKINSQLLTGIRDRSGVILQDYGLFPWKTVYNNLALGLKIRGAAGGEIKEKVNSALKRLKISELKDKYPAELSGGQKQRVAVGRSLVLAPDLLLMDEPFSALDALTREEMQNLILEIHARENFTYVLVTHDIAEAAFLGHKIAVIKKGKIAAVLENPHFGEKALREKEEFFELQKKLRNLMSLEAEGEDKDEKTEI